jgi:hypothetical protein
LRTPHTNQTLTVNFSRLLLVLEDQLKQATKDFDDKTENLKKIRPPTAVIRHDINLNKRYEN